MKSAEKSFIQGYNAQAAVDSDYQVIVAVMVTNQAADSPREAKPEPVTKASTTRERMKSKVLTEEGRARYGLRKETVEPVFGQIKRCMGFRQFSMRGKEACEAEWSLVCAAHIALSQASSQTKW